MRDSTVPFRNAPFFDFYLSYNAFMNPSFSSSETMLPSIKFSGFNLFDSLNAVSDDGKFFCFGHDQYARRCFGFSPAKAQGSQRQRNYS
jgi:hypothetical protein